MESKNADIKECYNSHLSKCWEEHKHFKETKDKIVFFIGTLFITVLFGSGFLIYKSYELSKNSNLTTDGILDRLYSIQYLLMHLFFFLLYLYYTYNNILEKIFLIETQCCHYKIREQFPQFDSAIPVPHSLIKRYFGDGINARYLIKVRNFKDASNSLMVLIYILFSAIPLFFKKDFILFNSSSNSTEVKFQISWIVIGSVAIGLLVFVIVIGKILITGIKKQILLNWEIPEQNNLRI